jgi:hypothetical protein
VYGRINEKLKKPSKLAIKNMKGQNRNATNLQRSCKSEVRKEANNNK